MINILIVDDSPLFRLVLRTVLESDPQIKVIGEARSGEEAVALSARLRPNIITMDINMPGMGGYEAIRLIMSQSPCPIVALTGIESRDIVDVSFKALALGALIVLPKPIGRTLKDPQMAYIVEQLKIMSTVKVVKRSVSSNSPVESPPRIRRMTRPLKRSLPAAWNYTPRLVAIGISTGGPPALQTILSCLSASFPIPIVIVQHISKGFVKGLANWLTETTGFPCKIAETNEVLSGGRVYLAPDDCHLEIQASGKTWLSDAVPIENLRPSAEALFQSIARNYGPDAIGILMTGMGRDGAHGLLAMHQAGAYTIAQDENSSIVFGMPKEAIDLGAINEILPLEQIAPRLLTLVKLTHYSS
jgi:two-component system, chemotaxis family, protein-glutamate methylesterase/glutaminase